MLDAYETGSLERILSSLRKIEDALLRAKDGFDKGRFESDQWGYAYIQLSKAATEIHGCMKTVLATRGRYNQMTGCPETSIDN
jgi:hypothetical protein